MSIREEKIYASDRFMPCVLSRLTDHNPQSKTEDFTHGLSIQQLKIDILNNIKLILNSRSHLSKLEMGNDPLIESSTLGLGLFDFCGCSHNPKVLENLRQEILRQIQYFEPRILAHTVQVDIVENGMKNGTLLQMRITGTISATPLSEELVFDSRLDLESGITEVNLTNGNN